VLKLSYQPPIVLLMTQKHDSVWALCEHCGHQWRGSRWS
jgi:hypothetical protein